MTDLGNKVEIDITKLVRDVNRKLYIVGTIIVQIKDGKLFTALNIPYEDESHIYPLTNPINYKFVHTTVSLTKEHNKDIARASEEMKYIVNAHEFILSRIYINPISNKQTELEYEEVQKEYQTLDTYIRTPNKIWLMVSSILDGECVTLATHQAFLMSVSNNKVNV